MSFDDNQNEYPVPSGNNPQRKSGRLLPRYFRTDVNKKFLSSTLDQLIQPGVAEKINGYLGRKTAKAFQKDNNYISDVSAQRENYQLEPVLVSKDNLDNVNFYKDYNDYINQIEAFSGNVSDPSELNASEYYAWNPNIDWDKFVNFREYYWLPTGPDSVDVFGKTRNIQSTFTVTLEENDDNTVYKFSPPALVQNPTLELYRGQTYRFEIDTPGFPIAFATTRTPNTEGKITTFYNDGVTKIEQLEDDVTEVVEYVEKGYIEFTVPLNSPDVIYYISQTDQNTNGVIRIFDIVENTEIDVNEILGKKSYKTEAGFELSNGMKVKFVGDVTPAKYASSEWYVEGVGSSITLVDQNDLIIPSLYSQDIPVPFDSNKFDKLPFANANSYAGDKDYLVVNRASLDRNPWTRYNRWFHKSVIEKSDEINGSVSTLDQEARAKRPIIEFEAGLKLYKFGTKGKQDVDLIDTFTRDVFSTIEGSPGYNIDGVDVADGMRILFNADTDIRVKNKIYQVEFILHNNVRQIALREVSDTDPLVNETVLVQQGNTNKGKIYFFNGTSWTIAQEKLDVNQPPLFDLFDDNGISYGDVDTYDGSTFRGNKIFSYQEGTGITDSELGFPISYRNIENTGDIVFDFNLLNDSIEYQIDNVSFTKNTDIAFLQKYSSIDTFEYTNGWSSVPFESKQSVVRQYIVESNNLKTFTIDVYAKAALIQDVWLRVFVNNQLKFENVDYTRITDAADNLKIQFVNNLNVDDIVIIKSRADAPKNNNGHYEFPFNLERNPLNENITNFTLGEVNDHVASIVEELNTFSGTFPGPSNLRDLGNLDPYGKKFLKHAGPINLPLYHLTDKNSNIIKALKFARAEYGKFKRSFLQTAYNLGYDGSVKTHVDLILTEMNKDKSKELPFYFSDMVPYTAAKITRYEVEDPANVFFALNENFNLNTLSAKAVTVYQNGEQLLFEKDYTFNDEGFCIVTATKQTGDIIELHQYESTDGSYVPPTPTKLGLYPKYVPEIYIDDTYLEPQKVIQGHDGSITIAYDDFRDELILELEKRIYNNIKQSYNRNIFDIHDFTAGQYRKKGIKKLNLDNSMISDFIQWLQVAGSPNYTDIAEFYSTDNPFTYNYSFAQSPLENDMPGFWRGVYKDAYDTDRPHTHPWEMLGFSIKPDWWETQYGPAPYTRDNLVLWEDLSNGKVREPNKPTRIRKNYIRPTLLSHIPVDEYGKLLNPLNSNYANGIIIEFTRNDFAFGDTAPVEAAWRRSSEYPFSVITAIVLNKPAKFFGRAFDISRIQRNLAGQLVYTETMKPITLSDLVFPNTVAANKRINTAGLINYIANYFSADITTSYENYINQVKGLKNQIGAKLGGFTDKTKFNLILDSRSPFNTSNVFVPQENYQIFLNTSSPVDTITYSGIIIEKQPSGYLIKGYDRSESIFRYHKPLEIGAAPIINVGGVSEPYANWAGGQTYYKGQNISRNNEFFRVLEDHTTTNRFDNTKYKKIASLPIVGGASASIKKNFENTVSILPYGTVLTNLQDVVDFLLGYDKYLTNKGFIFDYYNTEIKQIENMGLSVKEFLFWTTQNWADGSLLTISPGATELAFKSEYAVVDSIFDNFYDYSIFKADGQKIKEENLKINREDNVFRLSTRNTADGIYNIRLSLVQTEHVLLLDNNTVFNDVIYDLAPGYRQERIKVLGYRSDNWNGSLNIPGFIYDAAYVTNWESWKDYSIGDIVKYKEFYYSANKRINGSANFEANEWIRLNERPQAKLLTNAEYRTNQFADFYDLDTDNFDVEQQKLAQHLIGYQKREYLQNIINDDVSQYKFYQGFIQDKGTQNALSKLFDALSSADKESLDFYEEWAIRLGQYGAVDGFEEVEYKLDESYFDLEPQPIELVQSIPQKVTDLIYRIPKHQTYLEPANYDHRPFPIRSTYPTEYVKSTGYVSPDDINAATLTKNGIVNLNINSIGQNGFAWVGRDGASWNVLKGKTFPNRVLSVNIDATGTTSLLSVVTDRKVDLAPGDIIGLIDVPGLEGYHVVNTVDVLSFTIAEPGDFLASLSGINGILTGFVSARVANLEDLNEYAEANILDQDYVWIDNDGTGNWKVYQNKRVYNSQQVITNPQGWDDSTIDSFGSSLSANNRNTVLAVGVPDYESKGTIIDVKFTNSSDKISRTPGTYNDVTATGGTGFGAKFNVTITAAPNTATVTIVEGGTNYRPNQELSISVDQIGGSGTNLTFTPVTNVGGVVNVYVRGVENTDLRLIQTLETPIDILPSVLSNPARFGAAVAVSPDGKYLAVGSPEADDIKTRYKGDWNPSTDYAKTEIVKYNESLWQANNLVFGESSNILFTTFDAYAFFAADTDSTDLKLLQSGNNGLFEVATDHILIRAPQDMYKGTTAGDTVYLKWNNYSTANLTLSDTQPFAGYFPEVTSSFLSRAAGHVIQDKIDHVFNVINYTILPEVGDTVRTDTANAVVRYVESQEGLRAVIYVNDTNGTFTTTGNLLLGENVLIGTYTEENPKVSNDVGGYWKIPVLNSGGLPATYTTTNNVDNVWNDTGRGLVYKDIENAIDPDGTVSYYYNIQDNIQDITVTTKNDQVSFFTHLSYTGIFDSGTGPLGNGVQEKASPWWVIRTPKVLSDSVTVGDNFNLYVDALGDLDISSSGFEFNNLNDTHTIIDLWDGYIDMEFTEFQTADDLGPGQFFNEPDGRLNDPFQPTPKYDFDASGNLTVKSTYSVVRDLVTGATAEVMFYQRKFNAVRLYVKDLGTGTWSAGSDYGEVAAIERVGPVSPAGPDRTMGEILATSLGSSKVGKLFVVSEGVDNTTVGTYASIGEEFDVDTNTFNVEPEVVGGEYWFYQERNILGIPALPSYPDSRNNEWTQIYNLPADKLGTGSGLTSEGMFTIYERLTSGEYNLVDNFTLPTRGNQNRLGSKLKFAQNGNLYTLFVGEAGTGTTDNSGKIHIIKHGNDGTRDYTWEIGKDSAYRGEFNSLSEYSTDEIVIYDNKLYKSKTNLAPGSFTVASWDLVTDNISRLGYLPSTALLQLPDETIFDPPTDGAKSGITNFIKEIDSSGNGQVLVTSADLQGSDSTSSAAVVVYRWNNGNYGFDQQIDAPEDVAGFGCSVSLSNDGTLLAIGQNLNSSKLLNQGSVYVYKLQNQKFVLNQVLSSPGNEKNEKFGTKISFDGNQLAITSLYGDADIPTLIDGNDTLFDSGYTRIVQKTVDSGVVYLYERIEDKLVYGQTLYYQDDDTTMFGENVLVSNNHVYIAAPRLTERTAGDSTILYQGVIIDNRKDAGSTIWNIHRSPSPVVDLNKMRSAFLYNTKTNALIDYIDIIDPLQGKIAGPAEQEISYKTYYDPALYNVIDGNAEQNITETWGERYVGNIWWNLDAARFYNPYQNDTIYQANYWNRLFPGTSVEIYEWVESTIPPGEWDLLSGTDEGEALGITGTSRYGDRFYTAKQKYDSVAQRFTQRYYFWVLNKATVPAIEDRYLSAASIGELIANPSQAGYRFVALLGDNKFALYNCGDVMSDQDVAINFRYYTIDKKEQNIHSEYQIITEGLDTSRPKKDIEQKWFDSLIGYDQYGRSVPDPTLSVKQKYGSLFKPRQSWFINQPEALKQTIDRVNSVLSNYILVDNFDLSRLNEKDPLPSSASAVYDVAVDTYNDLRFVGTAKVQQAELQPVIQNGKIIRVNIINSGRGYLVPPTFTVKGEGTDFDMSITINNLGQITSVAVINQGKNYLDTTVIEVRKFTSLVRADETATGRWTLNEFNKTDNEWNRISTQRYDVSRYWEYRDWYADGYNEFVRIDKIIEQSYELYGLENNIGDTVKIENIGSGGWLLLEKIANIDTTDYTLNYKTIGRQNATVFFLDTLYDVTSNKTGFDATSFDARYYDIQPITETRIILETLRDNIFVDELSVEYNKMFFGSIRYALSEQNNIDWAFKTSFIKSTHNVGELEEKLTFKNDNLANYEDYVNEVKPYKTKVREYVSAYDKLDPTNTITTDFDLPPTYNSERKAILPETVTASDIAITGLSETINTYPKKFWTDNVGFEITNIEVSDTGSGYLQEPVVTITGGGGTGATAKAYIGSGRVTRIQVTNAGTGYISAPRVIVSGSVDDGGTEAKAVAILGNSKVRGIHVRAKFDRVSGNYLITSLSESQNFVGTGANTEFSLKFPAELQNTKTVITLDGIEVLKSEYTVSNVPDNTKGYTRYTGLITFNNPPASGKAISVTYNRNIDMLDAQDRINLFYDPTTGMIGKDISQLMDGIDYGGVEVKSLEFKGPSGWDQDPWFTTSWDTYDSTFEDEIFRSDTSTQVLELSKPLETGIAYNVYLNGVRIDDPNYGTGDPVSNPNAIAQTITGAGQTTIDVSPSGLNLILEDNDQIIVRKSTSDGSFLPDPLSYDTQLSGGDLAYSTAKGIDAESINLDGDGFVTPTTSKGPEELVPGQIVDTLDLRVYQRVSDGSSNIYSQNYITDGVTDTFDLGITPNTNDAVFVRLNKVGLAKSEYTINAVNNTVTLTSVPAIDQELNIITLGNAGEQILDIDTVVTDGSTSLYETNVPWQEGLSSFVTIDGEPAETVTVETSNGKVGFEFAVAPSVGSAITYGVFVGTQRHYSQVKRDIIYADGSTREYKLPTSPIYAPPISHKIIVSVNDKILNAGYNQEFTVSSQREYQLQLFQQPFVSLLPEQVTVFLNGELIEQTIDYRYDIRNTSVVLFSGVGADGDKLEVFVNDDGEYQSEYIIDGDYLIFDTSVALPLDAKIEVIQFSNHDLLDVKRINYDVVNRTILSPATSEYTEYHNLTTGLIKLRSEVIDAQYVWVTLNGVQLSPSVDYYVTTDRNYVKINSELSENDVIELIHFSATPTKGRFGYRQFKDMLNRTHYKRLNDTYTFELAQPLNWYDLRIELADASQLTEPNKAKNLPGIIFIDGERIEYFVKEGNTLRQLRRGTLGTGVKQIYGIGTKVIDQSGKETIPYKDEIVSQTFMADGTTASYELDFTPNSINDFEVFAAGRRLRKTSLDKFDPTIDQDSPEGDIVLDPEFTLIDNMITLNFTPTENTKVIVVRKVGKTWTDPGISLSNVENNIGRFLRGATVDLPE